MRRVLSYGGGLDSFVMLLDAIDRGELPEVVLFVDVADGTAAAAGEDPGEWPGTYQHIREVVMPLCARAGVEFVWLDSTRYPVRNARSLFAWMWARKQIPVSGPKRICTRVAKVERFERWMNDRFPGEDVEVWIGFEAGEEKRIARDPNAGSKPSKARKPKPTDARRHNRFPLVERGLCRCRCVELVRRHGHPVPRKSACMGCCYNTVADWQTLARQQPAVFESYVQLEDRKPPTRAGHKLTISSYKTIRDADGNIVEVRSKALPIVVQGRARPRRKPCPVCGAVERATKATGCGYLEDAAAPARQLGLLSAEEAAA